MLKNIRLDRPLAVIDLETTGTDVKTDRIIEISILELVPDGEPDHRTHRVNPGIPIPPEASAIHGITDADVAGLPQFKTIAASIVTFLDGCDLCGFNLRRYDLRLLNAELTRAGKPLPLGGRRLVDVLEIYHEREKRDLAAALRFYCEREHDGAHGAAADVLATAAVLDAQVVRYGDLPQSIPELHGLFIDAECLDVDGCFKLQNGQTVFAFGKYKGKTLDEIAATKPDYLQWMLREDFLEDAKAIAKGALARNGR